MMQTLKRMVRTDLLSLEDPLSAYNGFCPSVTTLPKGYVHKKGHAALECDIIWERDQAFTHSDGTTIYMDVFRPADAQKVPAILAWSLYGKSNNDPPWAYKSSQLSMLQREEGPDPAYWCARGYAVVNPDARGSYRSEGVMQFWGTQEGKDVAEVIEHLAAQDWCNGKVGMAGNSWLAISQWFAADRCPPHLAAIAPWEGMTDVFRESMVRGGIPNTAFPRHMISMRCGSAIEDTPSMADAYPVWNEYWEDKHAVLKNICVPAYIVASYTNAIHAAGTFRAWREIASEQKWLRIHNISEWPDFYTRQEDLQLFFAHFLKGEQNDWEETPRVRMSLLNPGGDDVVERAETEFPPESTVYTDFYLDAAQSTLECGTVPADAHTEYDSEIKEEKR